MIILEQQFRMESEDSVNEENVSIELLPNEEVSDNKSGGQSDGTISGSEELDNSCETWSLNEKRMKV